MQSASRLLCRLANDRQLEELRQFCTNPEHFTILSFDPMFNIFDVIISLTVSLKLNPKSTDKPPVFIGPLLLHQSKDWKTYSNFAHSIITEKEELEGILACGTDGEKALINSLKKHFRFAVFLHCFTHFKDNIQRELERRGITGSAKQKFIDEIFGKHILD